MLNNAYVIIIKSKCSDSLWIVLAKRTYSHPPPPELSTHSYLQVIDKQLAASPCLQLGHQVKINVVWPITTEKWRLCQVKLFKLSNSFGEILLAFVITLRMLEDINKISNDSWANDDEISCKNTKNIIASGCVLVGAKVGVEGVLKNEFRMPKQAVHMGQYILVNMILQCFNFSSMPLYFLNKIFIFSKKFTNAADSRKNHFGLKGYDNLYSRPSLFILYFSQIKQIGSSIQVNQITDSPKAKFIIVEQQIKILRLPRIIAHVEGNFNKTIIKATNLLLCWKIIAFPFQDTSTYLLSLRKNVLEVAVKRISSIWKSMIL